MVVLAILCAACGANNVVPQGQVAYQVNPAYVPGGTEEQFSVVHTAGENYNPGIDATEPIANIQQGMIGLFNGQILSPGIYPRIPASFVLQENAAVIQAEFVAIYTPDLGESYQLLTPGTHNVRASDVAVFPAGTLRYRTLRADLLSDPAACASYLCEASLSGIQLAGTPITATVDVDIVFEFALEAEDYARLWELRNPNQVIQNYIASPLRGVRAIGITPETLETAEGRDALSDIYFATLNTAIGTEPLRITNVIIRGTPVGDDAYRQNEANAYATQSALEDEGTLIAIQSENSEAQMNATATASAFERSERQRDADTTLYIITAVVQSLGSQDPLVIQQVLNILYPGSFVNSSSDGVNINVGVVPELTPVP